MSPLITPALITILVLITIASFAFCLHVTAQGAITRGYRPSIAWRLPILSLTLVIVAVVMLMSGCTTLSTAIGPRVANAVARYCREPQAERMLIREQVRTLAQPNSIQVNCAGDETSAPPPQ